MAYTPNASSADSLFNGVFGKTVFTWAHGLGQVPRTYRVEATTTAAAGLRAVTVDATNVTVTYLLAPSVGTNNLGLHFEAAL